MLNGLFERGERLGLAVGVDGVVIDNGGGFDLPGEAADGPALLAVFEAVGGEQERTGDDDLLIAIRGAEERRRGQTVDDGGTDRGLAMRLRDLNPFCDLALAQERFGRAPRPQI